MTKTNTKTNKEINLDNAAKIYPAAATKKWNSVFSITSVLNSKVDPFALQKAVKDLKFAFETFYMNLEKGFFWDKLVPAENINVVEKEKYSPCRKFNFFKTDKPLFRVIYNDNNIRLEFSHCLTDGTGGLSYMKSLLLRYFEIVEKKEIESTDIIKSSEVETESRKKDEFFSLYKKGLGLSRNDSNAYQIKLDGQKGGKVFIDNIVIPVKQLKAISKGVYNCTVTQYVSTVYALALLQFYKNDEEKSKSKKVKLSIPVNLRNFYECDTLRNFASYVVINVTPEKEYTFENVLELIKKGMKEKITKENLFAGVSQNVADEKMIIAKYSPNAIKKIVMRNAFYMFGELKYTSTVTSVGVVKLPSELSKKVDYIFASLGSTAINKINCAVLGSNDKVVISISSVSQNKEVSNFIADFIASSGISIDTTSNILPKVKTSKVG